MTKAQFNIKLINYIKDILLRLHDDAPVESVKRDFDLHFKEVDALDILLIVQELKSREDRITSEDVIKLFDMYAALYGRPLNEYPISEPNHHPVPIFKQENEAMQTALKRINSLMESLDHNQQLQYDDNMIENLKVEMSLFGQFYNHYNRKEKLYFPILERYGYYTLTRTMWAADDRIRNLYKGTKGMMERIPELDFKYVKKSFDLFASKCKEMIFDEEVFLLPIVQSVFSEDNWMAIAKESDAFGYTMIELEKEWEPQQDLFTEEEDGNTEVDPKHFQFGGGYLTLKEANAILNNLPLEITFVDKNGIFKYFNEIVKSSDMMFIRTPSSIGRNVANCHPPKSLSKVMKLIRDLKTGKRSSENMWFKKKDQYIHITYKGLFAEDGEFLGILEYVQNIQPFFDLPREVKKEISLLK